MNPISPERPSPFPPHEPERLLSRPAATLSSIPNGGEGQGEEALRRSGIQNAKELSGNSLPIGWGEGGVSPGEGVLGTKREVSVGRILSPSDGERDGVRGCRREHRYMVDGNALGDGRDDSLETETTVNGEIFHGEN